MPTPTTISFGDQITEDSVATMLSLTGVITGTKYAEASVLVLSRDGSRRILRVGSPTIVNLHFFPTFATNPIVDVVDAGQRWEGVRHAALHMPRETGQNLVIWNRGSHRTGAPTGKAMVGLYCPYTGRLNTELSKEPVNHIPGIHKLRSDLALIASGWDSFWHGRYIFANHLRQQVVSRLVDGLLAYGWAEIAKTEAAARPSLSIAWKTELLLMKTLVEAAVGPITGLPELWSRRLARNITLEAFRLRLDAGQVPGVDTRAMPWGATAETLISTTPTGDVNEKKVAVAEWHETNLRHTEDVILKYHDDEMQRPVERSFGYNDDHEHNPLA